MNSYEAKQEARRERLMDAAARANLQGESLLNRANEELGAIPFGQPILVGHHSERPMRRLIEKNHNRIRKGLDTIEQAKTLEQRAAAVGSGGISSDDPDAISKLEMKLEMEVISHRRWKAIIKAVRKEDAAALRELKLSADELSTLKFSSCGLGYVLTNASANMRRIRQRIDELKKRATLETRPDIETEWYRVTEDVEANRIARPPLHLVGHDLGFLVHLAPFAADETFHGINGGSGIEDGPALGDLPHQPPAVFRKGHHRWRGPGPLGIGNHGGLAVLPHGHHRIGRSQINTYRFRHKQTSSRQHHISKTI